MRRPLVVWTVLFFIGVIAGSSTETGPGAWLLIVALCGGATLWLASRGERYGVAIALLVVAAGGWWHAHRQLALNDGLDTYVETGPVLLTGVVIRLPDVGEDRAHYLLRINEIGSTVTAAKARPLVRVTVEGPAQFAYGDVLRVRAVLQRPRPATNPGAFDYKEYLAQQGVTATAYVQYPRHVVLTGQRTLNPLLRWAANVRDAVTGGLYGALTEDTARLLAGIVLGDRRGLSSTVEDDFRRAGISHLLAVSGMHVGFLAVAAGALFRVVRLPKPVAAVLATALVWTYVLLTGARPPALRAGVAGSFGLLAFNSGRSADSATALAVAALVLLVQNPLVVHDVSFGLSFAAAAAILVGYVPLRRTLMCSERGLAEVRTRRVGGFALRLPAPAASVVALAVAAQWGVVPLVARVFYEVSTVGLLAGLLAAPLVALLVPIGLGTALLHSAWPQGAQGPAWIIEQLAAWLSGLSQWFAALPWAYTPVPRPSPVLIGAVWTFGVVLARGAAWSPRLRRRSYAFVGVLLLWSVGTGLFAKPGGLELIAIDVGQGDALLIRTPSGATALIDGGGSFQPSDLENVPNTGTDVIIPFLRYRGLRRIDVVVNTHPHEDHLQGLLPILAPFGVRLAVDGGPAAASPSWYAYLRGLDEQGIIRHVAAPGDILWLDAETRLEVLHPRAPLMEGTRSDLNNNSVVLRLVHGQTTALLTGDIEAEAQLSLLREGAVLQADVVKVPHHGSRWGLVAAFYEAVGAGTAIITVGRNNHGHPSPEVIEALHQLGAVVYRTDVHGAVILVSDGKRWQVRTMLGGS